MRVIHKYNFPVQDYVTLYIPYGAKILCVDEQYGDPCIWALVENNNLLEEVKLRIYGTGHMVEQAGEYLGTVQLNGGALVFHIFKVT